MNSLNPLNPFEAFKKVDKQLNEISSFIKEATRFLSEGANLVDKIEETLPLPLDETEIQRINILAFVDYGYKLDASYNRVDLKEYMKTLQTQIYNLYENEEINVTVHLAIHTHNSRCKISSVKRNLKHLLKCKTTKHHRKKNRRCKSESSCSSDDSSDCESISDNSECDSVSDCESVSSCLDDKKSYDKINIDVKFIDYNNYNIHLRTTGNFDRYYVGPSTCRSYTYLQTKFTTFVNTDKVATAALWRIIAINNVSNIVVKNLNDYGKGLDLVARLITNEDMKDIDGLTPIETSSALAIIIYLNLILRS